MLSAWSSQRHARSIIGYQQSAALVFSWCHLGAVIHCAVSGSVPLHHIISAVVNTANVAVIVALCTCISAPTLAQYGLFASLPAAMVFLNCMCAWTVTSTRWTARLSTGPPPVECFLHLHQGCRNVRLCPSPQSLRAALLFSYCVFFFSYQCWINMQFLADD